MQCPTEDTSSTPRSAGGTCGCKAGKGNGGGAVCGGGGASGGEENYVLELGGCGQKFRKPTLEQYVWITEKETGLKLRQHIDM